MDKKQQNHIAAKEIPIRYTEAAIYCKDILTLEQMLRTIVQSPSSETGDQQIISRALL